jgi:hypothetical protein
MAKTARKESEEVSDVKTPDFAKALRIIRNDVRPAEELSAAERGKLSGAWKAVEEDANCCRAAAKIFAKLLEMSDETRDDYLRTLYGLMTEAGIGISRYLVDQAEGKEHNFPVEGVPRDYNASDAEWNEDGATSIGNAPMQVKGVGGITGDALPPELQAMAAEGAKPKRGGKPALVTLVI